MTNKKNLSQIQNFTLHKTLQVMLPNKLHRQKKGIENKEPQRISRNKNKIFETHCDVCSKGEEKKKKNLKRKKYFKIFFFFFFFFFLL